jgi:hypothetical protein
MTDHKRDKQDKTDEGRRYTNLERILGLLARTSHLLTAATFAGGVLLGAAPERLRVWRKWTAATGGALLISEAAHSKNWPHQIRGLAALLHAALLFGARLGARTARAAVVAAVITGSTGSHAPKSIRRWSVVARRVVG